jgi:hypothetical protein
MSNKIKFLILILPWIISCDDQEPNYPPGSFTVTVENVTKTSAHLQWTASVDPEGGTVQYEVLINGTSIIKNLTEQAFDILDLDEAIYYQGEVISSDNSGKKATAVFYLTTDSTSEPVMESNALLFEKRYAISSDAEASDLVEKRNGGYYALGSIQKKAILLSLNEHGDTLWTWRGNSQGHSVIETPDMGCIIVEDSRFVKLNVNGVIENVKQKDRSTEANIIAGNDGGYLVNDLFVGGEYPTFVGVTTLRKIDDNLGFVWAKQLKEKYRKVIKLDGVYAMLLIAAYGEQPDFSYTLMTNDGVAIKTFNYGESYVEYILDLYKTFNGDFLLAGEFTWASDHAYLIRTNTYGELIWKKEYYNGVHDRAEGVVELNSQDIVVLKTGASEVHTSNTMPATYQIYSKEKIYLLRLDKNGELKSQIDYSVDENHRLSGAKLIKTKNGYAMFTSLNDEFLITQFTD